MLFIYNNEGKEIVRDGLVRNSQLHFNDVSINLTKTYSLFIRSTTPLTISHSFENNIPQFFTFITNLVGGELEIVPSSTIVHTTINDNGTDYEQYIIRIAFRSEIANTYTNNLIINIDGDDYVFGLNATSIDVEDRLIVLLQNHNIKISGEYYTALKESDYKEEFIDEQLLNIKRREFLLNLFEITGFDDTYKGLLNLIRWFGWGNELTIKEYWKSLTDETKYRQTDILNSIVDADPSDNGFRKTNFMGLFYQINVPSGEVDELGCPLYDNVNYDTEEVLIKLYTLRRILDRDFLPLHVKIIDIVGEFTSFHKLDIKFWINHATITNIDGIKDISNIEMDIANIYNDTLPIRSTQLTVKEGVLSETGGVINFDDVTSIFDKVIFEVDQVDVENPPLDNYELITRFWRGDVAILDIQIPEELDESCFYQFYIQILKDDGNGNLDVVYDSDLKPIVEYTSNYIFAIREEGTYRIQFIFKDFYGGQSILSRDIDIEVVTAQVDFHTLSIKKQQQAIPFWLETRGVSTYRTNEVSPYPDRYPVIDPIETTLDINTFDPSSHSFLVAWYNKVNQDQWSSLTLLSELNNIPTFKLNNVPIIHYGGTYDVVQIDVLDDLSLGFRDLNLKIFDRHDDNIISIEYTGQPDLVFIQEFVDAINNLNESNTDWKNAWNKVTASINYYSPDDIVIKPMLLLAFKEQDDYFTKLKIDFGTIPYFSNRLELFSKKSSFVKAIWNFGTGPDDFFLDIYDLEGNLVLSYSDLGVEFTNHADMIAYFGTITSTYPDLLDVYDGIDHAIITSDKGSIRIKHAQLGHLYDIVRNHFTDPLEIIGTGSDYELAEPLFAIPNLNVRYEIVDVQWELYRNNEVTPIFTTNSWLFKYVPLQEGAYTLKLSVQDRLGNSWSRQKNGTFLVGT